MPEDNLEENLWNSTPIKTSKEELKELGANCIIRPVNLPNDEQRIEEYMFYESDKYIIGWKKSITNNSYHLHVKAEIKEKYKVD